jgi:hypothetical protein
VNGQEPGDYCWVRVRVLGPQDADDYYRVEVEMDDGRWFQHKMKLGDAEESALVAITPGNTQAYGMKLYQLLFSNSDNPDEPSLREALQNAWGRAGATKSGQLRVQLWISPECNELHRFRWERLFMPLDNQWRALANFDKTPFSRFTRLPLRDPDPGTEDRPLKVLVAISNPRDLAELPGELAEVEVEKEIKNFYEAIKDFPEVFVTFAPGRTGIQDAGLLAELTNSRFTVIRDESTTINLIQRELANHHILHFVGHGTFEKGKRKPPPDSAPAADSSELAPEKPRGQSKRATWLVLEDEDGNAEKVEDAAIVHNLIQRGDSQLPRLIFLSSCDTSRYDERNPRAFNSLAPRLVEAGFPAVVAMQDKVPVDVANKLTRNFYGNLLEEGVIDSALNRSRWFLYDKKLLLDNWTIPVLFMRTPRGQLFTADPKRMALRAISESKQFAPLWDYDFLPLEAVVLVRDQIKTNWENTVLLTRARVDLREQLYRLLNRPPSLYEDEALVIALTGDRGTARSTTAKAIVRLTAEQSLALSGDSPKRPILPVYVDLAELVVASSRVPSYLTLLSQSLKNFWPETLTEEAMEELLYNERFRIIFDNGDDLSPSQRNQLVEEVGELTHKFPQHQYLLIMGRGIWRLGQDKASAPRVRITHLLDVQPISRYRIEKFLDDCVEFDRQAALKKASADNAKQPASAAPAAPTTSAATAVTTVTLDTPGTSVTAVTTVTLDVPNANAGDAGDPKAATCVTKSGKNAVGELRQQLERTQLFDLAAMPWMLVMMIRQAQGGELPKSRVGVLRDLIEDKVSWITQWRGQQARALDTLYELAFQMQRMSQPTLPIRDALTIIARVRDNREYALEEMLDSLTDQDLLASAGSDAIRFLYPQYQAYCCAQYLCRQNNPKLWEEITAGLGRITQLRRWNDTLTLLCGLLEQPQVLLEKIAYATSLKDGEQVYLAARCLLEARQAGGFAEAHANEAQGDVGLPDSYVESLVLDALLWRSDATNEPRAYQRLRAVEALGRQPNPEVARFLRHIAMEKTRKNSLGEGDFEYGGIRQAAGRALRRMLSSRDEQERMTFLGELLCTDPYLEELVRKWIEEDVGWLTAKMTQPFDAIGDADEVKVAQALAGMAAFALGDLRRGDAYDVLIKAFTADSTRELVRWAITDALAVLDPDAVIHDAVHPLLDSCRLSAPTPTNGERREQLIYLIGQLRHPDQRALAFVEGVLESPDVPYDQKGRAILAIGLLYPPMWEDWKRVFEQVALAKFDAIHIQPKDQNQALYLQTKAMQSLAEIGDLQTLETLRRGRRQWPIELERVFYSTSEEIVWRNSG